MSTSDSESIYEEEEVEEEEDEEGEDADDGDGDGEEKGEEEEEEEEPDDGSGEEEGEEEEEEEEADDEEEGKHNDGDLEEEVEDIEEEVVEEIEEEEEEGEEEEIVKEKAEVEEEEEEIEEERVDAAIPMDDDADDPKDCSLLLNLCVKPYPIFHVDNIKNRDPEAHSDDLELVTSISLGSEYKKASPSHGKEDDNNDLIAQDPLSEMLATQKNEVSDNSEVSQLAVQDKHISSEENEFPKCLLDEKEIKVLAEERASIEDPNGAKSSYIRAHGSHLSHICSVDSIGDNNRCIEENLIGTTGNSDDVLEIKVPQSQVKTGLQMRVDSSLSSKHTPQRRPRSSSPGNTIQNLNKKPAIICDFFARGWCIKGNSCRFLHQKDGSKEDLHQKEGNEDLTVPSTKVDIMDGTGANKEAERSKVISSQELLDLSNTQTSSKSQIQIQRDLVRAYGGDSDGSAHFNNDYNSHIREESHKVHTHQGRSTFLQEEYKPPFGVRAHFDPIDEGQTSREHLLSTIYVNEGKLQMGMPRMELLNDTLFPRGSSLSMDSFVAEKRNYSDGQSSSSSIYNNFPLVYDKGSEDIAFHDEQTNFPLHGSYSSYSLTGSSKSNFNSSLQTAPVSPSPYNGLRSTSLPRSSSPYFSRPEIASNAHRISRDLPTWEPSIPFRPSFQYPLASLSSSGNQYDPLIDSIESSSTGNITLQSSERTDQNVPSHSTSGDPMLYGRHVTGMQSTLSSFQEPYIDTFGKSAPPHGLSTPTAKMAVPGPSTTGWVKGFMTKEEKVGFLDHLVESTDVNDADVGGDPSKQPSKGRIGKESKGLKIFRAALVEFVKELVKPSWREGHSSKDAHKTVVKKAVEKVLNALQPHQVPSTTESIDQYLSISQPKILKLVEGYVGKYSKSLPSSLLD